MGQDVYQLTPQEAQFYHDTNHSRFLEFLNVGIEPPIRLCIYTQVRTNEAPCRCFVAVHGVSQGQEILFHQDWIRERIRCITSIMRAEQLLMQMLPSRIVSQIMYLQSTSQFLPLIQILRRLQEKVNNDPKEFQRFAAMIRGYEHRHMIAVQQAENGEIDNHYNDAEFKAMVYQPSNILPLEKLRLSASIKVEVHWFCKKYQNRKKLIAEGLPWGNRILLAGPPGNGKTALAGAMSKLLNLPIFIVNMGELRQSQIGETGKNISTLFQGLEHSSMIKDRKAIIFFDECDSVATRRIYEQGADKEDAASLNVLLTGLDQMDSETIVIAATNYPDELDSAFKRRFSSYLWLAPPSAEEIRSFVTDYQREHKIVFNKKERDQIRALYGKPWAKVTEFCQSIHTARIIGSSYVLQHTDWSGKEDEKRSVIGFSANR